MSRAAAIQIPPFLFLDIPRYAKQAEDETSTSYASMDIESINLPKVERFPCTKSDAKDLFGHIESLQFKFGRSYLHTPRYANLKLTGLPVAHASYSTGFSASHVHVFPIRRESYSDDAASVFTNKILPRILEWIESQYAALETAPAERDELFVTWLGKKHEIRIWKLNKD